jgi:hypothetical protein
MDKFKEGLKKVADDLFKLEINTVIKSNMTARKMPQPLHALLDITHLYAAKFHDLKINLAFFFDLVEQELPEAGMPEGDSKRVLPSEKITNAPITFSRMRWAAKHALEKPKKYSSSDQVVLQRIRRNCDQLKGLLKRYYPTFNEVLGKDRLGLLDLPESKMDLGFNGHEMTLIRKIWEIGVEQVAMQTVVQLDGDVVTRINDSYAEPEFKDLHAAHQQGVKVSLEQWAMIANTLARFFSNFGKIVKKRRFLPW